MHGEFEMSVANNKVLRCSARWTSFNGQDNVNVWWFRTSFGAAQTDEDTFDAVDAYLQQVYSALDARIRSAWAPHDLKVDVVENTGQGWQTVQNVGFASWGSGLSPSASGDALPEGVSPLGFLYTGLGKHQGRKFFFGATEADSDAGGNVSSTLSGAIVTGLSSLLVPYIITVGNELIAVVAEQASNFYRDVVEVGASGIFGYQRRRRPGRGS
jgi:hypothetical protein